MGAGIAADPLSPDFDPLIRLRGDEPRRLVSAARSTSRRKRRQGFAFRSPGLGTIPLRASAPQPRRPARRSGPKSFPLRLGPYLSNRLSPGDERRAFGHHGQRPSSIAGTWRDVSARRSCLRDADACTSAPPGHQILGRPAAKARRTLRSSSLPRHKLLISLRFPASSSSAYSHDAVIDCESRQG